MLGSDFELAELTRRLRNLVRKGAIHSADYEARKLRVEYDADDSEVSIVSGWLPWATVRAGGDSSWWAPSVGEQVMVLSPFGEIEQGVVMPALYSDEHPAPVTDPDQHVVRYQDGTQITYNRAEHVLTVDVVGDVALTSQGNVEVTAEGHAKVTAATIDLDGASGGGIKGLVQGDCVCAFTGAPHPQVSATVKASA